MFSPNGSDPSGLKTILFVFILAMLAHLCAIQVAHGAERFVTEDPLARGGATLQLRGEATVVGEDIRLKQLARWAGADKGTLDPIGDLVVARFDAGVAYRDVSLADARRFLTEAGVNVGRINFTGPLACRVTRSDAECPQGSAIEQAVAVDSGKAVPPTADVPLAAYRTLRQVLIADIAARLNRPPEQLQVLFRPADEATLRLTEPHTTFDVSSSRVAALGVTQWDVVIGGKKRVGVSAVVKAWQTQLVLARSVQAREPIDAADVTEKRQLIDRETSDAPLTLAQLTGQAAQRPLGVGTVLTNHLVTPVELVRAGTDVTIDTLAGGVSLKTVARALENGSMGQTVRLRNEQTREAFDGIVTGPQTVSLAAKPLTRTVR